METTLHFLSKLAANNNRDWFAGHKPDYEVSKVEFKDFVFTLGEKMKEHDIIDDAGTKVYRIYRDIRFSKDKTPYNQHRSAHFKRAGKERRGGYYLRIEPGASYIAGGFWRPNSEDLLLIRKQIDQNPDELRAILSDEDLRIYFGQLEGEKVKTSPKGFAQDNPAIDLIRHKGFILTHQFSDKEVLQSDFINEVSLGFSKMRPFLDYMTEIVTTDLNGESLLK